MLHQKCCHPRDCMIISDTLFPEVVIPEIVIPDIDVVYINIQDIPYIYLAGSDGLDRTESHSPGPRAPLGSSGNAEFLFIGLK